MRIEVGIKGFGSSESSKRKQFGFDNYFEMFEKNNINM